MTQQYVSLPIDGNPIKPEHLTIQKAREVVQALQSGLMNWVSLVDCLQHRFHNPASNSENISAESIVFDVEVEVPQRPICHIRRVERIAVTFTASDQTYPDVYALRADFPQVSHLNLRQFEFPRSLCLFDEPYIEVKLRWIAAEFIERIRNWLADTATGRLHKSDQALEPLLFGSGGNIILPFNFFYSDPSQLPKRLEIIRVDDGSGICLKAVIKDGQIGKQHPEHRPQFLTLTLVGKPQQHGIIHRQPTNLFELHKFLEIAQINLLETTRQILREWQSEDKTNVALGLIIIVILPKIRDLNGQEEANDIWAFLCVNGNNDKAAFPTIKQIGEQVGAWEIFEGEVVRVVGADSVLKGENVNIWILNPCSTFSRSLAAKCNGLTELHPKRITAVGLGALGSQVFLNLLRSGYGEWVLIDNDYLLPHNLARHALFGWAEGTSKANAMSWHANQTIDGEPISSAIIADVLAPDGEHIIALKDADVILDCSASIAVARHLSQDVESSARRVSLFLNPTGSALVLLAEDAPRRYPLTWLEMQYYRLLITESALQDHLSSPNARIRYARSCRDLSNTITQDQVALCAAIGSRAFREAANREDASIAVWQADGQGSVQKFAVEPYAPLIYQIGEWAVYSDESVINEARRCRAERLPNETGGVLIGSYDMQRKHIYVTSVLPSPIDSEEEPTGYIRGTQGLKHQIENIKHITAGNLNYIGEWHSHPTGCGVRMSGDDLNLLAWLSAHMAPFGQPSLMLIVEEQAVAWNMGQIFN